MGMTSISLSNPLSKTIHYQQGLPVLPGAWPFVGHLPEYVTDTDSFVRRGEDQLGPLFLMNGGMVFGMSLVVCGPLAMEVLRSKDVKTPYAGETISKTLLGSRSLLSLNGVAHQRLRSVLNPTFSPHGLSKSTMGDVALEVIERHLRGLPRGVPFAVLPAMQRMTLEIIFRLFDVPLSEMELWRTKYRELLGFVLPLALDLPGTPWRRTLNAVQWLRERLRATVRSARENAITGSLLSAMSNAKDEDGETIDEDDLVDNLRLLLLAGHETTASVTAWMLLHLAEDPQLLTELQAEASRSDRLPVAPADIRQFPLAEGLFREALRLHLPVPMVSRSAVETFELGDTQIKKGTLLAVSLSSIARSPKLFKDPGRLDLRRFQDRTLSPLELSQFGGGPHFCLGYHLALLEGVQLAVALVRALGSEGAGLRLTSPGPLRTIPYPIVHPDPKREVVIA